MSNDNLRLPPIISDYIEKLGSKKNSNFQAENYCMILEGIRDACDKSIREYKNKLAMRKNFR